MFSNDSRNREGRKDTCICAPTINPHRRIPPNFRKVVSINEVETDFATVASRAMRPTVPKRW